MKALSKHQDTFRKQQKSGIHHEDSVLQEAATREESYKSTLIEYETELKTCKQALERFSSENERLNSALLECQQHNDSLEEQRRQIKNEIREYKIRENRNLADYAELEDENIILQKQVSQLKQSQVEFEGRKLVSGKNIINFEMSTFHKYGLIIMKMMIKNILLD